MSTTRLYDECRDSLDDLPDRAPTLERAVKRRAAREHAIYISGPMRGLPGLNFAAFHKAEATLKELGFAEISNPATLPESTPVHDALRTDYAELMACQSIAFLPDWEGSEGARTEYMIARSLDLRVMLMSEDLQSVAFEGDFAEFSEAGHTPIDDEAWRLVYGDRGQSYGNPTGDFSRTVKMWSEILGSTLEITPLQMAQCMIALKLSRLTHKPQHRDSWTDIIGYALCAQRIIKDQ